MTDRVYLIIRVRASYIKFQEFCTTNRNSGSTLVAACPIHEIEVLEPGTTPLHTWIGLYSTHNAAIAAWNAMDKTMLQPGTALVLAVPAFNASDDRLPSRGNSAVNPRQPPALMLIEGTVQDQEAITRYTDIIMPMLREREAYYLAYTPGHNVTVLSGAWADEFIAISRWPAPHAAYDFWLSNRYQRDAIPLRSGNSSFQVVTFRGERDDAA